MKHLLILLTAALSLASCQSNQTRLRSELQAIDTELLQLSLTAEQHQARMDEAGYDVLVGSFAAGYGATSGDPGLTGEGIDAAVRSSGQYDAASRSIDQLRQRHESLSRRRAEIVSKLD